MSMPPQGPYGQQGPQGQSPQGVPGPQGPPPGWQPQSPQGIPQQGYPRQPGPPGYPQQGGSAYPPNAAPRKKSKVPLILGIVVGSIAVVVGLVVVLAMTVFRAPTLAAERTRDLVSGGLTVGGEKITRTNESSAEKSFSGNDSCSTPSREALTPAAPVYAASGEKSVITVGRYNDASDAETGYKTITAALKDCSGKDYRISQPTFNRATSNGASYQTFKLTRNSGSQSGRDVLIIHYGNTLAIATAESMVEPKTTVDGYVSRYKELAAR